VCCHCGLELYYQVDVNYRFSMSASKKAAVTETREEPGMSPRRKSSRELRMKKLLGDLMRIKIGVFLAVLFLLNKHDSCRYFQRGHLWKARRMV
jgi:hypothetical protein